MINKKIMLGVVAVGLSTVVVTSAMASQPGFYVGGGLGYGNVHQKVNTSDFGVFSASNKYTGLAGRLFAGYQVNQNFAGEMGWSKFSDATLKASYGSNHINATVKTDAVDLVAKGIVPVANNVNVYGKAGVAYVMARDSYSYSGSLIGTGKDKDSAHKLLPTFGVGASYDVTPNLAADLSYNRIQKTGHSDEINSTDLVSVGLIYSIG